GPRALPSFPTRRSSDLSYGREAAGVMAAAVAEAMRPGAGPDSVVATCLRLAKDGTRAAIEAVCETARGLGHWDGSFEVLRAAVRDRKSTRLNSSHVKIS